MAVVFLHFSCQHIGQHSWSKSGGVGVDQEKQRVIAENFGTKLHQRMNSIFDFPDFALGASSIGRRVHNDGIVVISTADLTLDEFHAVIHQPADRSICKTTCRGIFLSPCDHTLRSIHMCDRSSGSSCRKSGPTCVGKKVQNLNGSSCFTNFVAKPVPVYGLFREKSCVLEAKGFQMEGQILVMEIPLLGQIKKFPLAAALGAAVIMCIHLAPSRLCLGGIPDYLRVRTHKEIVSPSLQLLAAGSINYFIFFPAICNPHNSVYLILYLLIH